LRVFKIEMGKGGEKLKGLGLGERSRCRGIGDGGILRTLMRDPRVGGGRGGDFLLLYLGNFGINVFYDGLQGMIRHPRGLHSITLIVEFS